jgi:hypothetical protein
MKTTKLILFAIIVSVFSQSCKKGGPFGIRGKGSNITEIRNLSGFDRINLSIDDDVYYQQDSVYFVEISAQANIMAVLKCEVQGTELKFEYRRKVWDHNKVKITVHSPSLKAINLTGNGDITIQNSLNTETLDVNLSGSGSIYIPNLLSQNVTANLSGIGDFKIAGGVIKNETLIISGSGDIDALGAVAESALCKISGFGNIKVHVNESLNAVISGFGDISYKGKPSVISDISGVGKVISLD